jgi:hypothetical protein
MSLSTSPPLAATEELTETTTVSPIALNRLVTCALSYANPQLVGFYLGGGTAENALYWYERTDHAGGTIVPRETLDVLLAMARHYADPTRVGEVITGACARHAVEVAHASLHPFPDGWV